MIKLIMFPNNQSTGYVTEMNRLFSMQPENDTSQMANHYSLSPFQPINRSSSSADSTSPESYPDITNFNRQTYDSNLRQVFETPRPTNTNAPKRRPIVGRKILGTTKAVIGSPTNVNDEFDINTSLTWQNEDIYSRTPPNSQTIYVERKNYTRRDFYELFPEKAPDTTPQKANISPTMLNYSPTPSKQSSFSSHSVPRSSSVNRPLLPTFPSPPLYSTPQHLLKPYYTSGVQDMGQKMCSFCRKNGETPIVYLTHNLKAKVEEKQIVTCPILRSHVCSTCGATGDNAHTITYCPVLRRCNNGAPLRSTTVTLKNTRLKSNGCRRY